MNKPIDLDKLRDAPGTTRIAKGDLAPHLTEEQLKHISACATCREYQKGELLFDKGAKNTPLFVMIGTTPRTGWLNEALLLDEQGFILTGDDLRQDPRYKDKWKHTREPYLLETNMPGVFAAGDVRSNSVKRVASAVGEGAMSVTFTHRRLGELRAGKQTA